MRWPSWPCPCQLCTVFWAAMPCMSLCLGRHAGSLPHGVRPRVSFSAISGRGFYVGLQCSIPESQGLRSCNCNRWEAAAVRSLSPSWQKGCPLNVRAALSSFLIRISTSNHSLIQLRILSQYPAVEPRCNGMCKPPLPASTCCSASIPAPGIGELG